MSDKFPYPVSCGCDAGSMCGCTRGEDGVFRDSDGKIVQHHDNMRRAAEVIRDRYRVALEAIMTEAGSHTIPAHGTHPLKTIYDIAMDALSFYSHEPLESIE